MPSCYQVVTMGHVMVPANTGPWQAGAGPKEFCAADKMVSYFLRAGPHWPGVTQGRHKRLLSYWLPLRRLLIDLMNGCPEGEEHQTPFNAAFQRELNMFMLLPEITWRWPVTRWTSTMIIMTSAQQIYCSHRKTQYGFSITREGEASPPSCTAAYHVEKDQWSGVPNWVNTTILVKFVHIDQLQEV